MARNGDMREGIFVALLILFISAGCTGISSQPDVKVSYPNAAHSQMAENAISIFMFIENKGDGDDYLVSARISEFPNARFELHNVVDGKMASVERIKIPADDIVELKGGSYHIMVFGVAEPIDEITVVLSFEKSGDILVKAEVLEKESKIRGMM